MNQGRRHVTASLAFAGLLGLVNGAIAKGKANHRNGPKLLGKKIKNNGKHTIAKRGPHTVTVDIQDEKIASLHVKHASKGELPVKKYKTTKKMALADGMQYASFIKVQDQYLGMTYIGFSYIDEYGDEEIYWFPYDMVLDTDTGVVEYIAV